MNSSPDFEKVRGAVLKKYNWRCQCDQCRAGEFDLEADTIGKVQPGGQLVALSGACKRKVLTARGIDHICN